MLRNSSDMSGRAFLDNPVSAPGPRTLAGPGHGSPFTAGNRTIIRWLPHSACQSAFAPMNLPAQSEPVPSAAEAAAAGAGAAAALDHLQAEQAAIRRALQEASGRLANSLRQRTAVAARLAVILDALPLAVAVVDGAGRVLQSSALAAQLAGLEPGGLWSTFLARLTPTGVADEFLLDRRCLRVQQSATPAGETIWTLADVTAAAAERVGLERERQLVALGQFAAHLAHQLRTPLAAALLHAGVLGRSALDDRQRPQLEALLDRLQHMQACISHAFDQIGDHASTAPARIALGPFVHGVRAAMAGLAARRGVELRLDLPEGCGEVTGWRVPLEGALSNLVDNAIHFSPAGGVVALAVEPGSDHVGLLVSDQGPGIDRQLLPRIFEPFVSARDGGTGLGLAIARGVVERHGGRITVDSAPGRGARFRIDLPRQPAGRPA
ncbi:MAG: HAMP domain-containing histidine kinase [Rhodocyclaceae bacterium]|nr:HAMP domain-containing histidine kinase [Rhodocyclaceae bacterium]